MLSYRKIIEKFEEFATNHFVIKSYGTGEAFQIVEHNKLKNRKYPMMWVEDLPFPFSTKSVTYSFRVYFLAQVATLKNASPTTLEQTNVVEVKSDMLQVAQDLVSFWVQDHNFDEIDLEKNTLATPFHDTLEDSLTGFYIDIKLEQAFTYNSCIIPMSGATPPPTEGVIITINGDSFTTTACGSSEDIIVKDTLGAAVGSKIGSEWIVPVTGGENVSNLYKTGVTDSVRTGDDGDLEEGRGVDWFNLGYNNPWGHGFRFVGSTGGYTDGTGWFDKNGVATTYAAAFPNDECSDWAYYNQVGSTVPMWYLLSFGTTTPIPPLERGGQVAGKSVHTAIDDAQASTQGGYSDWYLPNISEIHSIIYMEQGINSTQGLNYKPFEYEFTGSPSATGFRLVSGSINSSDTRAMYWASENGITANISPVNSFYAYFMKRNAPLTDFTF